ncbi:hypothetical protein TPHA_0M01150 [Tetrapisispora phaffii CBS 4417]|uniref:Small ribosomal subunit protein uS10m n=1 Tax=Tetrapisispora phaffii (strain ATCC 24235 / CBS 4417 / NBRC 1672 / NRRL Y-8282 / UCD 70-5) TaxID=1071381 RepID=G8C0H5_TETPH|nr:hypothetical protein TPHA_0M01150 [Tetrapisispora phaffii CBS 4417]CCE65690.1 hypothetical protein TPHA_0M01150 [Tetrapisispora phaffii CBS 4417]
MENYMKQMFLRRANVLALRNVRFQSSIPELTAKDLPASTVIDSVTKSSSIAPEVNSEKTYTKYSNSVTENAKQHILPVNVEAVYHLPLRNEVKYGDLIADIQLRSYDNENLDFFSDFILRVGYYLGMPMTGPKPLPTRRERWTVIRSPFAQAKSKENFERHTHKRLIRVWDTETEVLNIWLSYINKHAITGVGIKCNVFKRAGLDLEKDEKVESSIFSSLEKQPGKKYKVWMKLLVTRFWNY